MYIGSAVNVRQRWYGHLSKLRRGSHSNAKLQNAWVKYGEQAFEFMVVHPVEDKRALITWEQFWIDRLKPHYNICLVAGSTLGRKLSPEVVERVAAANRGRKRDPDDVRRRAEGLRGKPRPAHVVEKIAAARKGRPWNTEAANAASRGLKRSAEHRAAIAAGRAKEWVFVNPEGQVVTIRNLLEFCKVNGLSEGCMRRVHRSDQLHHKGWRALSDGDSVRDRGSEGQENLWTSV